VLTKDFHYDLPEELIAARPPDIRGASRLLVMQRSSGQLAHCSFSQFPEFVRSGDVLVLNDSKVLRARLRGKRLSTGGAVELLLLESVPPSEHRTQPPNAVVWKAMCRPAKKLRMGERLLLGDRLHAEIVAEDDDGVRHIAFHTGDLQAQLAAIGEMPLPPYILHRRKLLEGTARPDRGDDLRYQTVYAAQSGSVAAPTAGLHFTSEMLSGLSANGIHIAHVTLHVGAGTFKPVEADDPRQHPMHSETFTISSETADIVNTALANNRRVVAVGTTSVRSLESAFDATAGRIKPGEFETRLLILTGYKFQAVDALLTNFHLPASTLLMLVSAFGGHSHVMHAYQEAIAQRYRFYSYGDAMLIL
jgi:S-adenosylmethionine:tRNA ribosyltransferase-isomerase